MSVLLVTSGAHDGLFADGEPGHEALDAALAARGVGARWVLWDDAEVDWDAADLVAVRSTWDYQTRPAEFLAWARSLDQSRLLNGADVFAWNHDKAYLADLAGLAVVPTRPASTLAELRAAVQAYGPSVVKPAVGAGGFDLFVVDTAEDVRLAGAAGGSWVVQPLVESIRERGEASVFLIAGEPVCQFLKHPAGEEVRVHEHFGGRTVRVGFDEAVTGPALAAYDAVAQRFGRRLDYLRVDLLWWGGGWAVSELEAIEPGLYLDVVPANAEPFADLVVAALARRHAVD